MSFGTFWAFFAFGTGAPARGLLDMACPWLSQSANAPSLVVCLSWCIKCLIYPTDRLSGVHHVGAEISKVVEVAKSQTFPFKSINRDESALVGFFLINYVAVSDYTPSNKQPFSV